MARLIQRTEQGEVVHELVFHSATIGRGALNDVVIADPGERRRHARVEMQGEGCWVVSDTRSRTGLRVNGERVAERRELAQGDVLAVGPATFVFDATPEAEAGPATPAPPMGKGILRMTLGTVVSRVFGLVREQVAFGYFGATGKLDAYVVANTLPNLFRDVLGEYAAENAFMPAYKTLEQRHKLAEARQLFRTVMRVVIVVGAALVLLGMAFAPWVVTAFVPGFAARYPQLVSTATWMARWMMPYLLIIAVASVYSSLLLAERRFLLYSLAPVGTSACVILSIVLGKEELDVGALAAGIVVGGLVHMVLCAAPYVRRRPLPGPPASEAVAGAALRKVGRSAIPIGVAGVLSKVSVVMDQVLASVFCDAGRISALTGAARLLQLPFGILGLAVGRAAFPLMIEQAAAREGDGFSRAVVRAMRWNLFLMLPATLGIMLLAGPLVRLMYERGAFTAEHTGWSALALACYAMGLVAMGARTVLARAFYALLNTRLPLYASAVAVALNVAAAVALVQTPLLHGGLAAATALAAWFQCGLLLVLLRGELRRQGRVLKLTGLWRGLWRMALCGGAMALCLWGCGWLLGAWGPSARLVARLAGGGAGARALAALIQVGVPGLVGLAAYVGVAVGVDCDEVARLRPRRLAGRVDTGQRPR
jgi:putative peptidoglycan lipid II flippase